MIIPIALIYNEIGIPINVRFLKFTFNGESPKTEFVNPYYLAYMNLKNAVIAAKEKNGWVSEVTKKTSRGYTYTTSNSAFSSEINKCFQMEIIPTLEGFKNLGVIELTIDQCKQLGTAGIYVTSIRNNDDDTLSVYTQATNCTRLLADGSIRDNCFQMLSVMTTTPNILSGELFLFKQSREIDNVILVDYLGNTTFFKRSQVADFVSQSKINVGLLHDNRKGDLSRHSNYNDAMYALGIAVYANISSASISPMYSIRYDRLPSYAIKSEASTTFERMTGFTQTSTLPDDPVVALPKDWTSYEYIRNFPVFREIKTLIGADYMHHFIIMANFTALSQLIFPPKVKTAVFANQADSAPALNVILPNVIFNEHSDKPIIPSLPDPTNNLTFYYAYNGEMITRNIGELFAAFNGTKSVRRLEFKSCLAAHCIISKYAGFILDSITCNNTDLEIKSARNIALTSVYMKAPRLSRVRLPLGARSGSCFSTRLCLYEAHNLSDITLYESEGAALVASNGVNIQLNLEGIHRDVTINLKGFVSTALLQVVPSVGMATITLNVEKLQRLYICIPEDKNVQINIRGRVPRDIKILGNCTIKKIK